MSSRRRSVDWTYLRWLIERSLSGLPGFSARTRIEQRIARWGDGLFHDNYVFAVKEQPLVLRMAKRSRRERTQAEAEASLLREAKTLQSLESCNLPYPAPRLVCLVTNESGATVGLIETCMDGTPLSLFDSPAHGEFRLKFIAEVAARVHQLPKSEFAHLPACADSRCHVCTELEALPDSLFANWPSAAAARDWIVAHLSSAPSRVLHGDLLPQNLLCDFPGESGVSVIDWECARIGDPAYDLAIITRGDRKPLKETGGFQRLLAFYNEAAGPSPVAGSTVRIHELLLHLRWIAETAHDQAAGTLQGHGPEHYAQKLGSILRRNDG